jgi:glycosyltransferase involved in cell wall biosynthesis
MPVAIGMLDLTGYDLVISSNHAVANGVKTKSDQLHVSYTYSPMRYAWDLREQYLKESGLDKGLKGFAARMILSWLKRWDYRAAQNVDHFICISEYIRKRIKSAYGRDSAVVYPPVDTDFFQPGKNSREYYLAASRMVPYKMMPLIVSAFSKMPDRRLVVIGDGPELERVRQCAGGNIEILGYQDNFVLKEYLQTAKALVFAAEEDFGIIPVEAQACGTPVIGYGIGGLLETVNGLDESSPTGVLFFEQSIQAIKQAVDKFEQNADRILPGNCRANALNFSEENFRNNFKNYINEILRAA